MLCLHTRLSEKQCYSQLFYFEFWWIGTALPVSTASCQSYIPGVLYL